jgi:hypothetical protein
MGAPLNNITAPDVYEEAHGFLYCPGTTLLRFKVYNQAIYWRRAFLDAGSLQWDAHEEFLGPGPHEIPDRCDAIQIRAAVLAAQLPAGRIPAQVTVATRTSTELAR